MDRPYEIELQRVVLMEGLNIHELHSEKFERGMKGTDLRITDIGRGVLFERTGFPAVLVYPPMLKRSTAVADMEALETQKAEAAAKAATAAAAKAAQVTVDELASIASQVEVPAEKEVNAAVAVPPPVDLKELTKEVQADGEMDDAETRSLAAAVARSRVQGKKK